MKLFYCVVLGRSGSDQPAVDVYTREYAGVFTNPEVAYAVYDLTLRAEMVRVTRYAPRGCVVDRPLTIDEYKYATGELEIEVPDALKPVQFRDDYYKVGDIFDDGENQILLAATDNAYHDYREDTITVNMFNIKGVRAGWRLHPDGVEVLEKPSLPVPADVVKQLLSRVYTEEEIRKLKRIPRPN